MKLTERIEVICRLGNELQEILNSENSYNFPGFDIVSQHNPWFTKDFVKISIKTWADLLQFDNIESWLKKYPIKNESIDKTLGIIMAGNIPMVGMHDLVCGFACGLKMIIKLSS